MDLETLQVVLEMNTEKVQAAVDRILPTINNMMAKIERVTGKSMDQTEKNMDINKGAANMEKQLEKMNKIVEKQMAATEKLVEKMSANTGKNMSNGFTKARSQVNKDVDAIVKDINAKMMQAKSQQEKLAFLKTQRQTASSIGDTSGVIRFDEQIANAQAAMTRYQTSAENLARSMRQEFISLPKSLEGISTAMNKNEAQIESMRSKIKNLQVTYADQLKPKGSFSEGFKGGDETKSSAKTASLIDKQTAAMNKLIAQNDGLQQAYAKTQDRAKALSPVISKLNTNLGDTNGYTATKENVKDIGSNFKSSSSKLAKFGSLFSGLGNKMNKSGPKMNKPMNSINKTLSSFVRRLLIAGLAYKAFAGMASYMGKAVLSNEQFSKSLNEVKVNLATAFYPIYQAIMPALNALIAWLSKATAYMASFIATLFGTTYSAAKKGASALNENIAAMSDTGTNADKAKEKVKKFQSVLAGFDEINTLDFKTDTDDESLTGNGPANGIDFGIADPGIPAWVNTFADRFKSILKDLFAPIKAAWDKHGQKVMDAWKYALSEVGGLLSSIGKSFMEVWKNGTGERFVGNLLILLADVLNIIGDIAKAFNDAWNDDNRGTNLIQSIFNAWNGVLELLHEIASSFRKAWNNGNGERIAANILEIYTNIFNTIGNIADGLKEAWLENENGYQILDDILGGFDSILGNINDMTAATEKWAEELDFRPLLSSIAGLFDNIRPIIEKIGDSLSWVYTEVLLPVAKWALENALPVAIDAISEAFRLLDNILEAAKPVLKWLWEELLKPLGKWAGDKLVEELESIRDAFKFLADAVEDPKKAFSDLSDKTKEKFTDLKEKTSEIWEKIAEYITGGSKEAKDNVNVNFDEISVKSFSVFSGVGELASKIFPKLSKTISDNVGAAKNAVSTKFSEMYIATSNWFGKVGAKTKEVFDAVSSKVSEKAKSAYDAASAKWKELSSNTSTKWEEIRSATSQKWSETRDTISNKASEAKNNAVNAWSTMKSRIGEYMEGIKENSRKGFDQVVSWATGLGGRIAEGLSKGIESVKKTARSMAQGLVDVLGKGVNGTISGVQWVLDAVGSNKEIEPWKIPKYATGTNLHPGGPALVNDASSSVYQEAYELPDGTRGLFPKIRNMMVDLPANSKVLTAARTAKEQIPHYKNGVGDWLSEKWNGAKELVGDIWSYVKKPAELAKIAISKHTNLNGAKDPGLSIAKGAISTASSGVVDFIKDKLVSSSPAVNYSATAGVEQWRETAIKALKIENQFSDTNLKALLYQMQTESGGNPKAINLWDSNAKAGIPSKGLLQTIDPTYQAYKHPSYDKGVYDPLSNILASIRYAVSRYGSLTNAYKGVGYENGGLITEEQVVRVGEGNNDEMIIPLTKPSRALELIAQSLDYMGMDFGDLTMPTALQPSYESLAFEGSTFDGSGSSDQFESMADSMSNAVKKAFTMVMGEKQGSNDDSGPIEVTMVIDSDTFGKVVIKSINKQTKKTGKPQIIM